MLIFNFVKCCKHLLSFFANQYDEKKNFWRKCYAYIYGIYMYVAFHENTKFLFSSSVSKIYSKFSFLQIFKLSWNSTLLAVIIRLIPNSYCQPWSTFTSLLIKNILLLYNKCYSHFCIILSAIRIFFFQNISFITVK